MLQPGLDAGDRENYVTCGSATRLTPEEEFELIRWREVQAQERQEQWERQREIIRVNRHACALMMLVSRGCPQTPFPDEVSPFFRAIPSRMLLVIVSEFFTQTF